MNASDHRDEEVAAEQARADRSGTACEHQTGDVGAEDHELAVRHVDDAHLAEDDRKTERHQHEDGEQDQARQSPASTKIEPRSPIE